MAEIVNLRQVRKRKAKDAEEQVAAQNRILFGRTKTEKKFETALTAKAERFLDDSRLEKPLDDK
ncbi:hypothetical protein QFZ34_001562 [Phyllobacterium ifriqiyense]|uniref:DUF4169 family protein n=1 Tax=Phyllobacterium ifriqiyense TaxID=314238 RepID=A0ABU0S6J3_9HYPH|nr:DUF4169 family protein [Phyllobacterium ifriqiyense]MDQ0996380.1 hypothetical protein [Phyllobacterium ifriqiyense]